jgi:hypothetical protein
MGIIKQDEIRGYSIDGKIYCLECAEKNFSNGVLDKCSENEIITEQIIGDDLYFCDFHDEDNQL